jgi:hypothetical protein
VTISVPRGYTGNTRRLLHQQRRLPGRMLLHLPRHRVPPVRPQTGTDYPDQDAPLKLVAAGCTHLQGQREVPMDQEAG